MDLVWFRKATFLSEEKQILVCVYFEGLSLGITEI
jgi:hypothetical protein